MKNIIIILCLICFSTAASIGANYNKYNTFSQGTFKKQRNGNIVQFDKNGKKIGVYKIINGRYVQIK